MIGSVRRRLRRNLKKIMCKDCDMEGRCAANVECNEMEAIMIMLENEFKGFVMS